MKKLALISIVIMMVVGVGFGCGPRWEDTVKHKVKHPNGKTYIVYENTKTGECWIEENYQFIPVPCPKKGN